MEIRSRNTNTLQNRAYRNIHRYGVPEGSRNGPVLKIPEPVSIMLTNPWERVNLCPVRDANPFFHLWEGLAMLAGVNSVALMAFFAKNMLSFSDDGVRYNAFYGDRARVKWGDQIAWVINELKAKPDSRQCVVNLWDVNDWLRSTKDKACNLQMLFSVDAENKRLKMTTTNRSNDAVWGGVTGANVVHLSFFQEYVALALGLTGNSPDGGFQLGPWWHFSNNLHVYTDNPQWAKLRDQAQDEILGTDETKHEYPGSIALFSNREQFDYELAFVLDLAQASARSGAYVHASCTEPFLLQTAIPVFNAWVDHKRKNREGALGHASNILSPDWRMACTNWLNRRYEVSQ